MELDLEEIYNFVDTELKAAYQNAYKNPVLGYKQEMIITEEGKLYLSGRIQNENTISNLWQNNELVLYNLSCSNMIDEKIITLEDIQSLDIDDYEKLVNHIYKNYPDSIDSYKDDIITSDNAEELFYIDIDLDAVYKEVFPEKFEEIFQDLIEKEWDNYKRQEILDTIMKCINNNNLLGDEYGY